MQHFIIAISRVYSGDLAGDLRYGIPRYLRRFEDLDIKSSLQLH